MPAADTLAALLAAYEQSPTPCGGGSLITFKDEEGQDVYNCSAPFKWNGRTHLYGRVERREEFDSSHIRLFAETGIEDEFSLVPGPVARQLEDPFVTKAGGQFVLGGTQAVKNVGKVTNRFCDLYRGAGPESPMYYSSGPNGARYVRVSPLADGRVGVFADRATPAGTVICFTTVDTVMGVNPRCVDAAAPIAGVPTDCGTGGGVTHAYLLSSSMIGCLLRCCGPAECAASFVFDPSTSMASAVRVLATRSCCFPDAPAKSPQLADAVFPSGLAMRADGRCELYCGVGGAAEGRVTIDYPFEGHGAIVEELGF